jgi:hypothetical protein
MKYVYNIDLKDFFHSIDQARFWGVLGSKAFEIHDSVRRLMPALCFTEIEGIEHNDSTPKYILPQGAPTSPIISNIIAHDLDRKLSLLARKHHVKYSRYADDLTFSSMINIFKPNSSFLHALHSIIDSENFKLNEKKTRLLQDVYRQEVTGLVVNKRVNVKKEFIKDIRRYLYLWERYGLDKAKKVFENDFVINRYGKPEQTKQLKRQKVKFKELKKGLIIRARFKMSPDFINSLEGKLNYLKMIRGENDTQFINLKSRFTKLKFKSLSNSNKNKQTVKKITHSKFKELNRMKKLVLARELFDYPGVVTSSPQVFKLQDLGAFANLPVKRKVRALPLKLIQKGAEKLKAVEKIDKTIKKREPLKFVRKNLPIKHSADKQAHLIWKISRERPFRWTTHTWDGEEGKELLKDGYEIFIESLHEEFIKVKHELYDYNQKTADKIQSFLFQDFRNDRVRF